MLSRSILRRGAQETARYHLRPTLEHCRGLASPASGSFEYQTGDANGVKFASRDLSGPTTTLALVAKAGTRYQPLPGLTEGLEKFAFSGTERRSALRIVRESELLGAELEAYHTREYLIIGAKFLRDDLPYFVELLSEVATQTRYQTHTLKEQIAPLLQVSHKKFLGDTKAMALSSAHGIAFHRGLGSPLHPSSSIPLSKYVDAGNLELFSQVAYRKSNFAVVANGAEHQDVSKWVNEFFKDTPTALPTGISELDSTQTKYHGGEERIAHASGNTMVIGFPGSSSTTGSFYKPEIQVLASLLGGQSSIKWSPGFSLLSKASSGFPGLSVNTKSAIYSDAGLLYVLLDGPARSVASAATNVVKTISDIASGKISSEEIKKAKAVAKFQELEFGQNVRAGLVLTGAGLVHGDKAYQIDETAKKIDTVTEQQVKSAAKTLLEQKATVSAVGDLFVLPFAEEIGLKI